MTQLDELKTKGVEEVVVVCVNDAFVMNAWCKSQGAEGKLRFLADTRMELAKAWGLVFDDPGVVAKLGNPRCKRYSVLVDSGIVKEVFVQQEHNGVAGKAEDTYADVMLSKL